MGLFGALFAGVSGLDSQSNKIGIISNNISNVNTVGFKQGQAAFDTLVVPSGTTSFSPGGVIGNTQQLVNQQGLIQATTSQTDAAITGGGFFVVNTKPDGTGGELFTRAGSFTQDANGDFVNANGYFLQGLPIQANGKPKQPNTQNLATVNVSQSASGSATPTTLMALSANFNAAQTTLLGNGTTATMSATNGTSVLNAGLTATQVIIGNDYPGSGISATNNLLRGQTLQVISGSSPPTTDTFTYGGFTVGRDVTAAIDGITATGDGDGANILDPNEAIAAGNIDTVATSNQIKITGVTNGVDYIAGKYANISGVTTAPTGSGLTPAEINGEWKIISSTATSVTVQIGTTASGTVVGTGSSALTLTNRTYAFTGNILNATSASADFLASGTPSLTTADFASDALKLVLTVGAGTPATFTYSTTPDPTHGTFNSIATLASAISDSPGLTARVANGRLYVSATDANQQVTFANGDAAGSGGLPGIDWIQELDLGTLAGNTTNVFNSLAGLGEQIDLTDPTNLIAAVNNPNASATLSINEANPEQTIQFTDGQSAGSPLKELGIPNLNNTAPFTTGVLPIVYNPSSPTTDMSSGAVTAQFSHDITIYDAQGNAHTLALNVVKLGTNTWGAELTAIPASDVHSSITDPQFPFGDGQVASGIITFKGDGSLATVTGTIASTNIPINWTNGSSPSSITVNLGLGTTTGLTQAAGPFNVSQATQNGSPTGELTGVSIDDNGFIIANFSNGQTQKLFQVPLANVSNPNGLEGISGDAYQQTLQSGIPNLQFAGTSGVGTIAPSALEQSNVDLSTQLTNLIVAQQAYGANSKVLTIADQLLQQLDQIIQ